MKVDWVAIINKCKGKYPRYSNADVFGFKQIITFNLDMFKRHQHNHLTHIGNHKGTYDPFGELRVLDPNSVKAKMLRSMQKATVIWRGQPDLICDDPLYDGHPVR